MVFDAGSKSSTAHWWMQVTGEMDGACINGYQQDNATMVVTLWWTGIHSKGSGNISSASRQRNCFNSLSSKRDKLQLYFLLFIKDAFYRLPSKIDSLAHHDCDFSAQTGIWIAWNQFWTCSNSLSVSLSKMAWWH